jgi:hypothetical protein
VKVVRGSCCTQHRLHRPPGAPSLRPGYYTRNCWRATNGSTTPTLAALRSKPAPALCPAVSHDPRQRFKSLVHVAHLRAVFLARSSQNSATHQAGPTSPASAPRRTYQSLRPCARSRISTAASIGSRGLHRAARTSARPPAAPRSPRSELLFIQHLFLDNSTGFVEV